MKKFLLFVLSALLFSCDDGDLTIERVDFESVTISSCADVEDLTETTFFFKIDQDEALLLNLADGLLINEASTTGALTSTIPSQSSLIYRLFSDNVSQAYFCDAIPPLEPTVISENTATAGNLAIDTKVSSVTTALKTYTHNITISDLSLTNDQNERLTDSSTFEYGDFNTSTANSASLESPFSNYGGLTPFAECDTDPAEGSLRLYKTINDESIYIDIPRDSLVNGPTSVDTPRTINLEEGVFNYVVLDTLASTEMLCSALPLPEELMSWNFTSSAGSVTVETLENTPDNEGAISYTHNIRLENVILVLKGDGTTTNDAALPEIETVEIGTYTTFAN